MGLGNFRNPFQWRLEAPLSQTSPAQAQAHTCCPGRPHLCILVGGHSNKLGFLESKDMRIGRVTGCLWLSIIHLNNVQSGLVLMEGLEHNHLKERARRFWGRGGGSLKDLPALRSSCPFLCHATMQLLLGLPAPVPSPFGVPILPFCPISYPGCPL